ncbi:RNA polymerase sigma factor [Candidatus Solirubrobacter pratensis]|uniref:RNA polymerase sigma factor n=1 Tax=Candidatus Solirubrobacter pratensis TaxID=1298857 RepID=UPI0004051C8B|nr:sigma-70 family RNA polymerase sigma factor [Candidatus Solirubrobacter pratensis]
MGRDGDAKLLRDDGAFGAFYRRHERAVVTFVGRMVGDPEVTIDVVAETFARAYESRDAYRPEVGGARAWLLGIARHVVLAAWREGRVESEMRRRLGMRVLEPSEQTLRSVEEAVLESEGAVVEAWLADLPADQREAVRRRVLAEEDYGVIARDLECSPAVVRQRVSRGIAALRRDVKP